MELSADDKTIRGIVAVTAIIGLCGLQCYAWATGHNGVVQGMVGGILGLISGYYFTKRTST